MAVSYSWARGIDRSYPDYACLSGAGEEGLGWAQDLEETARARRLEAIGHADHDLTVTSIAKIARKERVAASTVRRRIERARVELFGALSDRGIR